MKQLFISIAFFIFILTSAKARTIQVANPGNNKDIQPAILSALNTAVNGDMIYIPQGEFIVNKTVIINKFISLRGAGIGKTILYRAESVPDSLLTNSNEWNEMFLFDINSNVPSNIIVTGITFRSKKPCIVNGDGGSLSGDIGLYFIKCVDFIVAHCRFEYFGYAAVLVRHTDTLARGLICKNEFYRNAKGFDGLGLGYGVGVTGDNKQWIKDPKFGSNNFIFIENNSFDYHRHAIAAGGCGLYVARYNVITNNIIAVDRSTHAIDAHEARGGKIGNGNYFSTRAIEAYNNIIINKRFYGDEPITKGRGTRKLIERAIEIRGGEALLHNNYIEGYVFGGSIGITPTPWGTNYPLPYSAGYLSGLALGPNHSGVNMPEGDGDVFYWNNRFIPYDNSSDCKQFHNYDPEYFIEGRDYHLVAKPGYIPYQYPHPDAARADSLTDK